MCPQLQNMFKEVSTLREEKKSLQLEIAELLSFYGKQKEQQVRHRQRIVFARALLTQ